jgi:hypothetical protein
MDVLEINTTQNRPCTFEPAAFDVENLEGTVNLPSLVYINNSEDPSSN